MDDTDRPALDLLDLTIESGSKSDTVTVPVALFELLAEDDASAPTVAGDIVLLSCAQRVHAAVHHSEGDVTDRLRATERRTMELFEDRFGTSFVEATGHSTQTTE